ncbi:p21-activated protein kinase-interacting protein 1-like, partial [Megalops cyprinoides]|uniref:p21-activated protein kinase-interacting protein 1-like n=1 Tax=Megalops cyprinoides TaxID=118141 RepID=UPI0018642A96
KRVAIMERVGLIAGSYEQIVFGYKVRVGEKEWTPTADFTHHAHTASLSAVAASDRFIATGSRDETIQLYDLRKRVEHGALLHHDGTISCLEFYGASHLLSGGEDGLLCVWSTKKWECLKSIKAHKGYVSSLSVHPSGKLALSVGTDKTLRTWNLIDGRSAFIKNIKQNAHIVMWSPTGDKYIVAVNNKMDIYSLETASVTGTITNLKRISSLKFLSPAILAVAGDEETLRLYDIDTQKCLCEFKAHETRVKALDCFPMEDYCVLVSASNDGFIKMWKVDLDKVMEPPTLLGEVNTTARLTCLAVWRPGPQQEATVEQKPQAAASQAVEDVSEPTKSKRVRTSAEEVVIEEDSCTKKTKTETSKKKKKQKTQ